jgi:hypothetical protein
LGSCEAITGFFSTSWGSNLERDQGRLLPKITAKNAAELANDTAGDPKRAKLVAEKILEALKNTTDPAEKAALLNAGLIAANNASDLIMIMMGSIDTFSDPDVSVGTILGKVQAAGDVQASGTLISDLLKAGGEDADHTAATQDNLVLAAVTLLLADAQEHDYLDPGAQETYLDQFEANKTGGGDPQAGAEGVGVGLTEKQKQALDLAEIAASKDGALNDVLKLLKLTS